MRALITILITLLLKYSDKLFRSPDRAEKNMDIAIPRFSFLHFLKTSPINFTILPLLQFFSRRKSSLPARYVLFSILYFSLSGTVTAANIPPEAIDVKNFPIQTGSGISQILPLIGQDADGSTISFKILTLPASSKGTLYLNGVAIIANQILTPADAQMLQFKPKNSYTGNCSFTFTVTDNDGLTDATPATYTIPVVAINQNLVCTGGGLGINILGAMGTFSVPFIVPNPVVSCINNGSTPSSPLNNIGKAHPELTSYTYASTSGSLGPEGTYSFLKIIGTWASRNCIKTDWVAADHTGDGGYAMIVNGSPNVASFGSTFFQAATIAVCPNTLYEFSAFVINVLPGNHSAAIAGSQPDISFYINNTKVSQSGLIQYSDASTSWIPQWVKVGGLWYSGPNTSVDLRIDNATFVASGNDLGLDDISMAICGPDISYPNTDLTPKFCKPGILPLEALVTSSINTYSHYIFERSTDGGVTWQILSTPKTGSPVYDIATDTYSYTATYGDIPVDASMNGYKYRLKVATNETNLIGETCNVSAIKVITVSAFTTPDAGADITGCNPALTAQLAAATTGQAWLTVAGNPATATINNAGTIAGMTVNGIYKFQLSNTAGCYDTVNVVHDKVGSAGADVNVCAGVTAYKHSDAGAGYAWESVAGNPANATIIGSTGAVSGMTLVGTYHFVLRSSFGDCTDEVTVTVPMAITASATASSILCHGGTTMVTITGSGGTAPLAYTFNGITNGSGIFNDVAAGAGYNWSVTDAGNCTPVVGLISITQPALLTGSSTIENAPCPGASTGSAIAIASGGVAPYSYSWNTTPVQTTATTVNLSAGTYIVTITDNNGCITSPTVTVISEDLVPPTFTAPGPFEFCVENLYSAGYISNGLQINPTPDYYLFHEGNTIFDLDPDDLKNEFNDNCCDDNLLVIHWRMTFTDTPNPAAPPAMLTHASIPDQTGQPSLYGSDIQFPGDGVNFTSVTHLITYWLTDCNGNKSLEKDVNITIKPRPNITLIN